MARLLIVSNRLPVTVKAGPEGVAIERSTGGLATGMSGHGFGIGPGFGRVLADLVTGGRVGHDLTRFRFSRFSDGSKLVPARGL